jgi:hypothetical protein
MRLARGGLSPALGVAHLYDEEMTELLSEASPRLKARLAGLFQLLEAAAVSRQIDLGPGTNPTRRISNET